MARTTARIQIALAGIENAGNLGAVARVMANFGFKGLILVDPLCSPLDEEAQKRAMHALPLLKKARVVSWEDIREGDLLVGTTARTGTDYNLPRTPLTPRQLASSLQEVKGKLTLLFGPEGHGLSNEQLLECDLVVTIPASGKYPTLNLSHAVGIMCYELTQAEHATPMEKRFPLAGAKEKQVALSLVEGILPHLELKRGKKEETQRRLWKRLLGKAMLTGRELAALLGFLRQTKRKLEQGPRA